MKKMILLIILLMVPIFGGTAFCEAQEGFTMKELFDIFENDSSALLDLFERKTDFNTKFFYNLSRPITLYAKHGAETKYDATLECDCVEQNACKSIKIKASFSREYPASALRFIGEAIEVFGKYEANREYFDLKTKRTVKENIEHLPLEEILHIEGTCVFSFSNDVSMSVYHLDKNIEFYISKNIETNVSPIGAGMYIGNSYQQVLNNQAVNVLTKEDSKLTLYSQIASCPAYFEVRFNEGQQLTHAKVFVAGSYSLDCKEYSIISVQLWSVYSLINTYETDNLIRRTFRTKTETKDLSATICIHEIKEEEGKVYHTLTFMPEEEYNKTLFLDYLNN